MCTAMSSSKDHRLAMQVWRIWEARATLIPWYNNCTWTETLDIVSWELMTIYLLIILLQLIIRIKLELLMIISCISCKEYLLILNSQIELILRQEIFVLLINHLVSLSMFWFNKMYNNLYLCFLIDWKLGLLTLFSRD